MLDRKADWRYFAVTSVVRSPDGGSSLSVKSNLWDMNNLDKPIAWQGWLVPSIALSRDHKKAT